MLRAHYYWTQNKKVGQRQPAHQFRIHDIYPSLVSSGDFIGYVESSLAKSLGLTGEVAVFAGGGDNACGALGAGVIKSNDTLCSIGTSGTLLTCESGEGKTYRHNLHYFNHVVRR
ncbi:putative sugar kinase [Staphylococcus saprophyticus]|nr:putative sugar kinase [Staphylococcus saprophyticus]